MSFSSADHVHAFVKHVKRLLVERGGRLVRWAESTAGELTLVGGHPEGMTISMQVRLVDDFWCTTESGVHLNPRDVAGRLLRAGLRGSPVRSMKRPPGVPPPAPETTKVPRPRSERTAGEHARQSAEPPMTADEVYAQTNATLEKRRLRKVTIAG